METTLAFEKTDTGYRDRNTGKCIFSVQKLSAAYCDDKDTACRINYRFIVLSGGSCECMVNRCLLSVEGACILLIKPNDYLSIMPGRFAEGYVISFSPVFLRFTMYHPQMLLQIVTNTAATGLIPVVPEDHSLLVHMAEELLAEMEGEITELPLIQALFQVFATYVSRAVAATVNGAEIKWSRHLKQFYLLLDQYFTTRKLPGEYAQMMAVTPTHLNSIVRKDCGYTAGQIIQQRVFAEARELMLHKSLSMKEVAYELGFVDLSHFSKFFKRCSGLTFTRYKKQYQIPA